MSMMTALASAWVYGINYLDLDDAGDDTSLALGARYYVSNEFAVGAGFEIGDDVTTWNIGARLEF